jgi:hypothetical protein
VTASTTIQLAQWLWIRKMKSNRVVLGIVVRCWGKNTREMMSDCILFILLNRRRGIEFIK